MKRLLTASLLAFFALLMPLTITFAGSFQGAKGNPNFRTALEDGVTTDYNFLGIPGGVKNFLQKLTVGKNDGVQGLADTIVNIIINVIIPILAMVGIFIAIIGFFKLMASTDEKELQTGRNYLLRGIIGTLIMVSAARVVTQLAGENGLFAAISKGSAEDFKGGMFVSDLYTKIFYPLIKVILSVIIGIMFIMTIGSCFKYLFRGDDAAKSESLRVIIFTVIGILLIILAKTLVEVTYGTYETVINNNVRVGGDDLGKIGNGVLENPNLVMLHTVLNWLLGLGTFLLTTIIIYIGYLMLVAPTDDETPKKLKTAILWGLGGILTIGAAYLLANFVFIK